MPIPPVLLIAGVRAAIQVYSAGDKALARHLRDRAVTIPGALPPPPASQLQKIEEAFALNDAFKQLVGNEPALVEAYDQRRSGDNAVAARSQLLLWDALRQIKLAAEYRDERKEVLDSLRVIEAITQWASRHLPPTCPG